MAPKTGSKKLVDSWRPERDLDCLAKFGFCLAIFAIFGNFGEFLANLAVLAILNCVSGVCSGLEIQQVVEQFS